MFSYSLAYAEQFQSPYSGYFQQIEFHHVREYRDELADVLKVRRQVTQSLPNPPRFPAMNPKNGEADYCLDVQVTGLASEQHAKAAAAHIQRLLFDDSTSDELKGK